jgi:hypothetical protein
MQQWQLLNGLRRPDGRLIYSRQREMYYLSPAARWVAKSAVSDLLAEQLVEQAGDTAGVYRLTRRGRMRWSLMPPDTVIEGACDVCGHVGALRPTSSGDECEFRCAGCRKGEHDVIETTYQTPVV